MIVELQSDNKRNKDDIKELREDVKKNEEDKNINLAILVKDNIGWIVIAVLLLLIKAGIL